MSGFNRMRLQSGRVAPSRVRSDEMLMRTCATASVLAIILTRSYNTAVEYGAHTYQTASVARIVEILQQQDTDADCDTPTTSASATASPPDNGEDSLLNAAFVYEALFGVGESLSRIFACYIYATSNGIDIHSTVTRFVAAFNRHRQASAMAGDDDDDDDDDDGDAAEVIEADVLTEFMRVLPLARTYFGARERVNNITATHYGEFQALAMQYLTMPGNGQDSGGDSDSDGGGGGGGDSDSDGGGGGDNEEAILLQEYTYDEETRRCVCAMCVEVRDALGMARASGLAPVAFARSLIVREYEKNALYFADM